MSDFTVVTLVNDEGQYAISRSSFAHVAQASPEFDPIDADSHGWGAATGLNIGLDRSATEWTILAHQDVVVPRDWWVRFTHQVSLVDPPPSIVGVFGCTQGGAFKGHILDPHGHRQGGPLPTPVLTVDEALIAVRTDSELRFDERIPGFHCYGADICLSGKAAGGSVIVVDAPIIHLSGGKLDGAYFDSATALYAIWSERGYEMIPTPATLIAPPDSTRFEARMRANLSRRFSRRRLRCTCDLFRRHL